MKIAAVPALLLACCWTMVRAGPGEPYYPDPYYVEPATKPYPPGCVTQLSRQFDLHGGNAVRFFSGTVSLELVDKSGGNATGEVQLDMYRVGCTEPNRSVVVAEFKLLPEQAAASGSVFFLPSFVTEGLGFHYIPLELRDEADAWGAGERQHALTRRTFGDYTDGWEDARTFTWRYVLDVGPGLLWHPKTLTTIYNERFVLLTNANGVLKPLLVIPATRDLLEPSSRLPLNGRLSGAWSEPDAADQGFVLSFSNPVPPSGSDPTVPREPELLAFLTWFTFDRAGRPLWMAGSARFPPGASEVRIPLIRVRQGQFLGTLVESAEAIDAVGEVLLTARSCNLLELDYQLRALDLGTGRMNLQRGLALETAGYPCRDYAARQASRPKRQTASRESTP